MDILKLRKNCLAVGRGSAGIYLILSRFKGEKVLLPSNICYAAIYPVIYSGNIPVFCDVDSVSGNVRLCNVKKKIGDVSAAVIPHMYGEPVADIALIKALCRSKGVLLIEDCASSMGASVNGELTGTFGDYVIFSTGYSKTVDIGNGGYILSDCSLDREAALSQALPLYDSRTEELTGAFSRRYRAFRNSKKDIRESDFLSMVNGDMRQAFLYRNTEEFDRYVEERVGKLDEIIKLRREALSYYDERISYRSGLISRYPFSEGAVPWRYNLFVDPSCRERLIAMLLENHIPVSDWYPRASCLFSDYSEYEGARSHEERILNFPLPVEKSEIDRISDAINRALECLSL